MVLDLTVYQNVRKAYFLAVNNYICSDIEIIP